MLLWTIAYPASYPGISILTIGTDESVSNPLIICNSTAITLNTLAVLLTRRNNKIMIKGIWIESGSGLRARILNYGAVLNRLIVPSRSEIIEAVLYYVNDHDYLSDQTFLGAVVGPWSNRIRNGMYRHRRHRIQLDCNEQGMHHLHGGKNGLYRQFWEFVEVSERAVTLACHHPAELSGYPGDLDVEVRYEFTADDVLQASVTATVSEAMPVSVTFHPYFNLNSEAGSNILNHRLMIASCGVWEADAESIPVLLNSPESSVFDLRCPRLVGEVVEQSQDGSSPLAATAGGLDHCWMITSGRPSARPRRAAAISSEQSRLLLEVWTDQPAVQCYTGQYLDPCSVVAGGAPGQFGGMCIEPELVPDQPNLPGLPSAILSPGQQYTHQTLYRLIQQ